MRVVAAVVSALGWLLILYGPVLWLWQIYRWLERGQWFPLPALLAFQNLSAVRTAAASSTDPVTRENLQLLAYLPQLPRPEWFDHPREWLGLHRAVMWTLENAHIGVGAALLGAICVVMGAALYPSRRAGAPDK